jgi:hypothetical protein
VDIVDIFRSVEAFREALRVVMADGRANVVAVGGGTHYYDQFQCSLGWTARGLL